MKIIAAFAVAFALTACAVNPIIPPVAAVPVAQLGTSIDLAYNVAAKAYISQLPTMPANVKATVKPLLVKAYPFVVASDKAQALGDAATVEVQAQAAMALIAQAKIALGVSQ